MQKNQLKQFTPKMCETLSMMSTSVHIWGIENSKFIWGNPAAIALWECENLEEFQNIHLSTDILVAKGTKEYLNVLLQGGSISMDWVIYPKGIPKNTHLQGSAMMLENGQTALLIEMIEEEGKVKEEVNRMYTMLRYASITLSMFALNGRLLLQNLEARKIYGEKSELSLEKRFLDCPGLLKKVYSLKLDKHYEVELQVRTLQGLVWHSVVIRKVLDPITEQEVFLVIEKNINELKETQIQLIQSEKMAGLGTLVSGIAHEINNPLGFASMNSQNLEKDIQKHKDFLYELLEEEKEILNNLDQQFEEFETKIKDIHEGNERIKTIVLDLRTFSRLDESEQKVVNVIEGINSTLRLVRAKFRKSVEFETDFQNVPALECWPAQLNQVFMNIIVNASQAIRKKQQDIGNNSPGTLTTRVFVSGKELVIQFQDTGCGMTKEVKQKVFEPFFTTKPIGEGTGMGMAITYGIVKKHQGRIEIDSTLEKDGQNSGTTFTLYFPL